MRPSRIVMFAVAAVVTVGTVAPLSASAAPTSALAKDSLGALAKKVDVRVGTAVDMDAFAADATYHDRIASEFTEVTPENVMKWQLIEPTRGQLDFAKADQLVAFAQANKMKVRGHTLLWHNQLPTWLTSGVADGSIDATQLRDILKQHIMDEVGHFKGKIWQWDVANEVIDDSNQLRNTIFLQKLGPGYIADAFRWAHQADPNAALYINDYNIEAGAKADAYF